MTMKRLLLVLLAAAAISSCKVTQRSGDNRHIYVQKDGRANKPWKLVWKDDFDGPQLDTSRWSRIPPNNAAWGRHMSSNDACYRLDSGLLYLRGIVNPDTTADTRPYLTGGIWSKGKFAFQYGRIEIRAKLECARGAWPAMWMLAEQNKYGAYPKNGEIDIMEHLNHDSIIYQTTHSWYTLQLKQTKHPPHGGTAKVDPLAFNTFGISWYPDRIEFQLNGRTTFTYPRVQGVDASQWPYDQPFYILIDQQLGGDWVGRVHAEDLPVQMVVDWVKVYQ